MKEYCRARDTGDQVLGLLVSPSALENPGSKEFVRHQSTLVCFQGMLDHSIVCLSLMVKKFLSVVMKVSRHRKFFPEILFQFHCALSDELTANLELGIRYDVPGLQTNSYFRAWNVRRWVSGTDAKIHHRELPSLLMPPAISTLHAYLRYVML